MNQTKLQKISKQLVEKEINLELLNEALTHRSFINEPGNRQLKHNERLEFIGDAVLELVISEFLFAKYDSVSEGLLTSFRAALVRTESLADEAKRLGLGEFINMSKGEEATGGRERPYILANTMEAVIGAIYLSEGYDLVKEFIIKNISHKIESIIESRLDIDAKTKLQEMSQEEIRITPIYEMISAEGPDHDKRFKMAVFVGESKFGEGTGKSKQEAEQSAAKSALDNWKKLMKSYKQAKTK